MKKHNVSWTRRIYTLAISISMLTAFSAGASNTLVIQFQGTGGPLSAEEMAATFERPGLAGFDPELAAGIMENAICIPVAAYDPASGLRLGYGIDCLENITELESGIITLHATTIFHLSQSGWIVVVGDTTVAPLSTDHDPNFTHSTGSIGANENVIHGSGRFSGVSGSVRLSGLVNLADFPNTMGFDCLWVLKLDY